MPFSTQQLIAITLSLLLLSELSAAAETSDLETLAETLTKGGAQPISDDPGIATLTARDSYGFRFSVDRLGMVAGIDARMHMYRSAKEEAPLMAYLHSDEDGTVGRAFARTHAFIAKEGGKSKTIEFPPPPGVVLRPGEHYWLVIDSPTGSEVAIEARAESKTNAPRFYRNLWNGEQRYDESPAAAFEVKLTDLPPELAAAEKARAERIAKAQGAGKKTPPADAAAGKTNPS